jgi:hypothetical protein
LSSSRYFAAGVLGGEVVGRGEAEVGLGADQAHPPAELGLDRVGRAVFGLVVDDDQLEGRACGLFEDRSAGRPASSRACCS